MVLPEGIELSTSPLPTARRRTLTLDDREHLERLIADRNTAAKVVWRARIVLATADAYMRSAGVVLTLETTAIGRSTFCLGAGDSPSSSRPPAPRVGAISASGSQMYSRTVEPVASSSAMMLPHGRARSIRADASGHPERKQDVPLALPELVITRVASCSRPL